MRSPLSHQLTRLLPALVIIYVPALAALFLLGVISLATEIPVMYFTRDPQSLLAAPFYIGLYSSLGVVLWCAAAAVCFLTYAVLRTVPVDREVVAFLRFAGVMTGVLLCDDLFLLHDEVFPPYLGIPEELTYAAYGLMALWFFLRFRKVILTTDYILVGLAGICFGLSLLIDASLIVPPMLFLFEDGFKLLGIVSWVAYLTRICVAVLSGMLRPASS